MGPTRFFPLLVVSLLLVACSDVPAWTGSIERRDGVEIIMNPGDPILGEAGEYVTELWSIQGSAWEAPTRVHAGSGLVTVVDPQSARFHVVTTSGEERESVGRPGGGPGEFLQIQDAFPESGGFRVLDGGRQSIDHFGPDGDYLSSLPIGRGISGGFPLKDGEMLLMGEFLPDPAAEDPGTWMRVSEGGEQNRFNPQPLVPLPEEDGIECSSLFSWAGGVARLRSTTPQIQVFDRTGSLLMERWIDLPIEPVTEVEREAALSELRSALVGRGLPPEFMQQNMVVMEERWRVKCRFGSLESDPSGSYAAFLEQNPDEFGSGNATLHLLSQNGVYLAKIGFMDPWSDFTLVDGVVYALARDPFTGLITLKAYRVDLPDSVFERAGEVLEKARRPRPGER